MELITSKPEFAGILREQETYAVEGSDDVGNRINGWFDRLMIQSGFEITPGVVLFLCLICGVLFGGLVWVFQENPLTAALATFLGVLLPIVLAMVARMQRQVKLLQQMPPMIDELARAAKTGRSIENCLQMVADDTAAPLGNELQLCTRKLALGLPIHQALEDLPYRTGLVSASVLTTALGVHRQTGGDLIKVLERLSQTVRDRMEFQGRLRAATAASRATAVLMITLPPAILGFFIFRDPTYFTTLMASSWGRSATLLAFLLEVIGGLWVLRIQSTSQKA